MNNENILTVRNYLTAEEDFCDDTSVIRLGLHFSPDEDPPILGSWILLEMWAKLWLESLKEEKSALTAHMYKQVVKRHMLPNFGMKPIGEISSYELQMFFDELAKTLSLATIASIRVIFSECFEKAWKLGIIKHNPVRLTKLPRRPRPKAKILDEDVVNKILQVAKDGSYNPPPQSDADEFSLRRNYLMILLAAASGLRREEILALTWPCVDTSKACLDIKYSHQSTPLKKKLAPPKCGLYRIAEIPSGVAQELERWREYQSAYASKYRNTFNNPQAFVFPTPFGKYTNVSDYQYLFKKICEKARVKNANFHDLRLFWGSSALSKGMNIAAISRQLGHFSKSITQSIYTQFLSKNRQHHTDG